FVFFFSSRRRHTRSKRDWSSDVCSSDLLSTLLSACKFGCCVVAHQPNAPIFLRLGRGLFYADVSVLLDTFSHNNLCIREHAFLPSWRLQLDNIAGIDSHFASRKYPQL